MIFFPENRNVVNHYDELVTSDLTSLCNAGKPGASTAIHTQ